MKASIQLTRTVQSSLWLRIAITDYEQTDFLINRIQNLYIYMYIIDAQQRMAATTQRATRQEKLEHWALGQSGIQFIRRLS